jgi:transcriptional regulator with XRE-family HTH domain
MNRKTQVVESKNIVGRQVAKLRNERGLSQTEFAAALQRAGWDISRETLAKIENGIRWVADFEIIKLAETLKSKVVDLFPQSDRRHF